MLQQVVGLADQLHVAVLDAVVHHLDVVPGTRIAHPVAARRAVAARGRGLAVLVHLRRNRLEDVLHVRPCFRIAARHDGRSEARAFFTARHAGPDEQDPLPRQVFRAPVRIREQGIAAIDDDVALGEKRQHVIDHLIDSVAGFDHQHHAPWALQQPHELLDRVRAGDLRALRLIGQKIVHF